jgi:hypothetical protein
LLMKASKQVEAVEEGIDANEAPATLSRKLNMVADTCTKCHAEFRD